MYRVMLICGEVPRNVERDVSVHRLKLEHDFDSNVMYSLNVFG